jgi:hypothetical protein
MNRSTLVKTWLAASSSLVLFSCAPRVSHQELAGRYQARYPFGQETVTLAADGTYDQRIELDAATEHVAQVLTNEGRWNLVKRDGPWGASVRLERCLAVNDGAGRLRSGYAQVLPGGCSLSITREHVLFGRLALGEEDSFPLVRSD